MKTALLFPGQGSQYVGMGAGLRAAWPEAARTFEEADDALGFALSRLILEGPLETLTETENNQPAILTVSVAYLRVLQSKGIQADIAAGHSLGEYAALVANGALSFADAVRLVRLRGRYMQAAVPLGVGTMSAVISVDDEVVERLCREVASFGVVEPAGYNAVGQVAVAGAVAAVEALEQKVSENKGMAKRLNVSAPFHCSLLAKAASDLDAALAGVAFAEPRFPYVANVDASLVHEAAGIRPRLVEQVVKAVRWVQSVRAMADFGVERWIEVGPGKTLAGLQRRIDKKHKVISVDGDGALEELFGG